MNKSHTVSVGVDVPPQAVYAYASDPNHLPTWATGFAKSIDKRDGEWIAQSTLGEVKIRFAPSNDFGVLDQEVELPSGTVHNPVRVLPNGDGSEVQFTLFQLPGVTDEQFQQDIDTVQTDLTKLRTVLEDSGS